MDPQAAMGSNPNHVTNLASPRSGGVQGIIVPMTPIPEDEENNRDTVGADYSSGVVDDRSTPRNH